MDLLLFLLVLGVAWVLLWAIFRALAGSERKSQRCPRCRVLLPPEDRVCWRCGAASEAEDLVPVELEELEVALRQVRKLRTRGDLTPAEVLRVEECLESRQRTLLG